MPLYFAFGSNMDLSQMKERCPDSVLIGKAVLKDFALAFTIFSPIRKCGCADVIKKSGSEVWGLLFNISDNDLKNLDRAEMHPDKYRRFEADVVDESGKILKAYTYEVAHKEGEFLKPSEHYLGIIKEAARVYDFPDEYKEMLSNIPTLAK